jgi:hypothetical protein
MIRRTRLLPLGLIAVIFISLAPGRASAGDNSFSSVVRHIKSTYRARQQGFFGAMMLARFAVKVVRPAGVKNFKVVYLRNLDFSDQPGRTEFQAAAKNVISSEWQPLVQYNSIKENQYTHVYYTQEKEHVKLLVVTLQKNEAIIVQTKFSPEKLGKFIDDPRIMGISVKDRNDNNSPNSPNSPTPAEDAKEDPNKGEKKPSS